MPTVLVIPVLLCCGAPLLIGGLLFVGTAISLSSGQLAKFLGG